jgi:glycosyltransferase involved in cell wall biosynthesis
MKVLVTTLGRGHFIQVADSLRRAGVDADLTQGWLVEKPEKSFWLRLAARIVGRQSLIWGFTKRTTEALQGHNFGDFFAEFVQTCFMLFFSRIWKNKKLWHWGVKTGFWLHGRTMAKLLKRGGYQIAHVKSGLGRFAIATAKKKGIKVLVDHSAGAPQYITEEVDGDEWGAWTFWWTVMQDCLDADLLMVDCDFVKSTFLKYGYPEEKIRVVYMGLDKKFNGLKKWDENLDDIGRSPQKPLRIVFSGPFALHKGNETFLAAIDLLLKSDLCFDVTVIGSSSITDEQHAKYKDAIRKIDFKGHVPQDQMCQIMQSHQIYLFPSLSEGCAKSAFEAMSIGLCVLCTFETGLPMTDGYDGFLIKKNDAGSIVARIMSLVENPHEMKRTGMVAAETMKRFTWEAYAENVKKVYDELTGE